MIKQRIMIVGSNGMLGQRLTEYYLLQNNAEVYCTSNEDESFIPNVDYDKIDLADKKSVKKAVTKLSIQKGRLTFPKSVNIPEQPSIGCAN